MGHPGCEQTGATSRAELPRSPRGEGIGYGVGAWSCDAEAVGSRGSALDAVRHALPQCPAEKLAAHARWCMVEAHGVRHGGPRGSALGRKVSMQIIRPRPQCGQSHRDTPVSR